MMKRWTTYVLGLSLFIVGCNKEPLPQLNDPNAPDYGFRGSANGEDFDIQVGVDDATLSYGKSMMNGIETFYGQIDAPSADFAMRVDIIEPERWPADLTSEELTLISDDPDFFVHSPACVRLDFGSSYSQYDNLLIEDENGQYQPETMVSFDEFGLYTINLKLTDYSPQPFSLPIRYGFEYEDMNPKFQTTAIENAVTFNALNSYPYSEWYINGDLESSENSFEKNMGDGVHEVKHIVRDNDGNEAEHTTLMRMTNGVLAWVLSYTYCNTVAQNNYGKMMVSFKKGGVWYKSSKELNNVLREFTIGDIQYIEGDETGAPEIAVFDLDFEAILKDDSQSLLLSLANISGTIAVGLK